MNRRRRDVLLGAIGAVAVAANPPAPALAQGIKELEMVTSWPENSVGYQTSAVGWRGRSGRCRTAGSR